MTDSDDKLSRRYRELAREEPSAQADDLVLAASRRAVSARPRSRTSQWMVPASIAAVLVLGIGVSLRMQLEQPGIESSLPSSVSEYSAPPAAEPPPPPAKAETKPETKPQAQPPAPAPIQPPPKPEAK